MTKTVRETKRADELKQGDWLAHNTATEYAPAEVLATVPYATEVGPMVQIIYRDPDGKPTAWDLFPGASMQLATDGEVSDYQDDQRRAQVAAQLHEVADLLVSKRLPLPGSYNFTSLTFHFGSNLDAVDRVAEILGVERTVAYGTGKVEWPSSARGEGLDVSWDAYAPSETPEAKRRRPTLALDPERGHVPTDDPTGLLHSRADDADDPTPVSPARVPLHTGGVVDGGALVEDPAEPVSEAR